MNIEKFILKCEEEKKKDNDLIEIWKNLYNKQKEYGNKYKPLYKGSFFNKKEICPNCKSKLIHKKIYKDGSTDIKSIDLLICYECNYKYAL